ncbi:UTP--glucose-1-phosphate uridylyltransferase GalU [Acidithiobacillus ferrooxidans]|jgi:UTP--glucose-1-phosphate uridylyltransferase|uniref:UTP--glucose-1-phosphate uridylyltransferase GalU n=1 Tax=Acidithiobacillus ferrooxidans TaxID=920 RepID=UPI0013D62D36|nr:UTP--glucose-1-phosphate uridylyltransferase GalU [Acidithiobacillus ferrooxidans]MBU2858697.1 UTP--glucose-1-phosphate uridylyltransferase GalU [Acidithiobacillus ferrooxidans]MBU2862193.1 UTP--glucose-1-phosphate uridylyltransferase GalU [Acidithiobacillus ferrooxidans]MCR2829534.1 UTP--glucose-1-phosphate uridylyltransferase GalU [Acidithiobacillus ferrooxidans]
MAEVRKAVFPVAGLGTRFLPATKASAKEMMPIVDKPLIQYAVEEAIAAGCDQLIFISGRGKRAIEDHFDVSYELEIELEKRGKADLLKQVQGILPSHVSTIFLRQPYPLGLGHAVLMARPVVGDEPFAVLLADDLMLSESPVLAQMVEQYRRYQTGILGVEEIPREHSTRYGVVDARPWDDRIYQVSGIVEKPKPEDAPSNLGVVGRYILPARIFHFLEQTRQGAGGEIQLTDAIAHLLNERQVLAYLFSGQRFDCGDKLGYLKATIAFGKLHPEVGADFTRYMDSICEPQASAETLS